MKDPLKLFYSMLRIRRVEEALAARYAEQEMRCPMHLCIGQEATAVGVCSVLRVEDQVLSGHRAHGHYLAKGGDLKAMLAEIYGKDTGCSRGRGGSMHLVDVKAGFLGSTPIVGGTVPLAVGAAWSAKLQNKDFVAAVFFGDGCFEEGVLHESMDFASLHQLPVLFVCENNGYSVYTNLASRQPLRTIAGVANAHGINAEVLNGNNVISVAKAANEAVDKMRQGMGPQFLEVHTYRWLEHCGPNDDDYLDYRPGEEVALWKRECPIQTAKATLVDQGLLSETLLHKMETDIAQEISEAFEYVRTSPFPAQESLGRYLYA